MNRLIIGAPFGNWLRFEHTTATLGTYTVHRRAGVLKRIWRFIATVRWYPSMGAWINRLGLPNPGIQSLLDASKQELTAFAPKGIRKSILSIGIDPENDTCDLSASH